MEKFPPLKLFITGPVNVSDKIKKAGSLPEFGHRDSESEKRVKPICNLLKKIANVGDDYEVIIIPGSGTTVLETSVRSLVKDDETVLNVSVGAFGDLYHKVSKENGKNAVLLKFDEGKAIDLTVLEEHLAKHKPQVVTFTHNETSTGVTNDLVAVSKLIRKHNAIPLVDGISIFGGIDCPIQEAEVTMYSFGLQKCLGLHSGFGVAFVHKEAITKAKQIEHRGVTTDILANLDKNRKGQILITPNCSLTNQVYVQLHHIVEEEGIENRFARHKELRDLLHSWVGELEGFELYAQEGHQSCALTTVQPPSNFTPEKLKEVKETMRSKGFLFDPGYGKLNVKFQEAGKPLAFRIGHMGDTTKEQLEAYLAALKPVLLEVK